ncbi:hypothetical protein PFICI_14943 [Pestalotiopsis fici W106-1]|uniref:Carboxylesterase type B domain-containing protein n=1 Tax=Pestalotiopsis fici (strain W106-1 / CGMCC3.15140) TaxID=1229662 RepID=W3WHH2_PESFW|nr:uncharacterized protein PFICI_14943 [Pestalotiopsis fici W106-1]ETS73338.1 hypothetical protein PFICI_14943 [Pestalotiopsis fici W106-1]
MATVYGTNTSGKWGMLDQFAALIWVRENMAAFGGDPNHITVMGQSDGSAATYHILSGELTRGFISGVRDPYDPLCSSLAEGYRNLSTALETGIDYVSSLNATAIADVQELPMSDLITKFRDSTFSFGAVLDGYAMPAK